MAERILKLKALHCNHRSSENLVERKKSSILKISKHKKHLSVRFEDQVPMASIKTLLNDIDKISSNIESCFRMEESRGNWIGKEENSVLGSGGVKKVGAKRNFERNGNLNEGKGGIKISENGSVLNRETVGSNRKYKNLVRPGDAGETDMRIVKKKILPSMSQKIFRETKNFAVGNVQGFYNPSPKIVKQSAHHTVLQKKWGKSIPLFKIFQNSSL